MKINKICPAGALNVAPAGENTTTQSLAPGNEGEGLIKVCRDSDTIGTKSRPVNSLDVNWAD
jgi:hypothetical protein